MVLRSPYKIDDLLKFNLRKWIFQKTTAVIDTNTANFVSQFAKRFPSTLNYQTITLDLMKCVSGALLLVWSSRAIYFWARLAIHDSLARLLSCLLKI